MDSQTLFPENTEERIVWYGLVSVYPLYFLGALYISGPVIGWLLACLVVTKKWQAWKDLQSELPIPWQTWVWIIGMLGMLVSLVVGHLDYNLTAGKLIKSSIGWAKGWALLAIFILAGTLDIRPQLLYRACMKVCKHTLILLPLFIGAWVLRLPETLYVSPLKAIGGPGPEFFALSLYEIDPQSGWPRWRLFTPWAPALAFVANIFFIFALSENNTRWKSIGISASIIMVLMSQSRLGAVSMIIIFSLWFFTRMRITSMLFSIGVTSYISAFIGPQLLDAAQQSVDAIKDARAASTRVRAILARIAIERWRNEAPIFGHGIVERGPHLVEFMPIGSHHTWYGLLFVKGAIGVIALLVPLTVSLLSLLLNLRKDPVCISAFCCLSLLSLFTLGENLEILAYLLWPALLIIGIAHTRTAKSSQHSASPLNTLEHP